MSHTGTWAVKDPDEIKDYKFNWAGTVDKPGIAYNDAIVSSTWDVPTGLTKQSDTFTSADTTIWLSGGTIGTTYLLTNHVVTVGGRHYDETVKLKCKAK